MTGVRTGRCSNFVVVVADENEMKCNYGDFCCFYAIWLLCTGRRYVFALWHSSSTFYVCIFTRPSVVAAHPDNAISCAVIALLVADAIGSLFAYFLLACKKCHRSINMSYIRLASSPATGIIGTNDTFFLSPEIEINTNSIKLNRLNSDDHRMCDVGQIKLKKYYVFLVEMRMPYYATGRERLFRSLHLFTIAF